MEKKFEFQVLDNLRDSLTTKLRNTTIEYITDTLKTLENPMVDFDIEDDSQYVTITHDGGRHPEYGINPCTHVYNIYLKDNNIFVDIDEETEYNIDRISTDDLVYVAYSLMNYMDNKKYYEEHPEELEDNDDEMLEIYHVGFYEDSEDLQYLQSLTPDEIVKYYLDGLGNFCSWKAKTEINKKHLKYTSDNKYAVSIDEDCFIDIYEL